MAKVSKAQWEEYFKALQRLQARLDRGSKNVNQIRREQKQLRQTDPRLLKRYGKKGFPVSVPGDILHHIGMLDEVDPIFKNVKSRKGLERLWDAFAEAQIQSGDAWNNLAEMNPRIQDKGQQTAQYAEDIHKWMKKNTPKDASWKKLKPNATIAERLAALDDYKHFHYAAQNQVQRLQFSQTQLDGIPEAPGAAKKPNPVQRLRGIKEYRGNFSEAVLNPRSERNVNVKKWNLEKLPKGFKTAAKVGAAGTSMGLYSFLNPRSGHAMGQYAATGDKKFLAEAGKGAVEDLKGQAAWTAGSVAAAQIAKRSLLKGGITKVVGGAIGGPIGWAMLGYSAYDAGNEFVKGYTGKSIPDHIREKVPTMRAEIKDSITEDWVAMFNKPTWYTGGSGPLINF